MREAEEMLPDVARWLRSAMEHRKNAAAIEEQMNALLVRVSVMGGIQLDVSRVAEMKSGKQQAIEKLNQAMAEIENSGCLVKDLDIGLVDFPTMLDDTEVYLCWKLDEPRIGFWHHTSEGFAGRKLIDRDFLDRHKGSKPH